MKHYVSKLSLEEVFASQEPLSYPVLFNGMTLYLTSLHEEKSRSVLKLADGKSQRCVTPKGYSLGTKINEYGGKPFWLLDSGLVFCNRSDQCLYFQSRESLADERLAELPRRLSVLPSQYITYMYSDVHEVSANHFIAIVERNDSRKGDAENTCFIGLIDATDLDSPPQVLLEGADFYSNLVLHQDSELAWVEWNHPNMPWDENRLCTATLNGIQATNVKTIRVRENLLGASHCQLAFSPSGDLFVSVDFAHAAGADNYWNVYRVSQSGDQITRLTAQTTEFGYPHWQYGDARITPLSASQMVVIGSHEASDVLYLLDSETRHAHQLYQNNSTLQHLSAGDNGALVLVETTAMGRPRIVTIDTTADLITARPLRLEVGVDDGPYKLPVSLAKSIEYPCVDGAVAHAFYYPPVDHTQSGPIDTRELPPLLVMVHGGPTARAYGHFDIQKQFWCSHGFAILDVNHRGSSGFGRQYRDALYGEWGIKDTQDIVDGVDYLVDQELVDGHKVCIRGKSAGGYAVLRALTEYPNKFKAGACYYGIGNLATLAEVTHKFEKHYTDRLINEKYDKTTALLHSSQYYKRSPINAVDHIRSAMIIFQGGQDKVVPPAVAHEMVKSLTENDVDHQYTEYADEGHGFRVVKNNIDAWSRELSFYQTHLQ